MSHHRRQERSVDFRSVRRRTEENRRRVGCRTHTRRPHCRLSKHLPHQQNRHQRQRELHVLGQPLRRSQTHETVGRQGRVLVLARVQRRKLFQREEKLQRARTLHHERTGTFTAVLRPGGRPATQRQARRESERGARHATLGFLL